MLIVVDRLPRAFELVTGIVKVWRWTKRMALVERSCDSEATSYLKDAAAVVVVVADDDGDDDAGEC